MIKRVSKHREAIATNKSQLEEHKTHLEAHTESLNEIRIKKKGAYHVRLPNAEKLALIDESLTEFRTFLSECQMAVTRL